MLLLFSFIQLSLASYSSCEILNCLTCSLKNPVFCNNCSPGFTRSLEGCTELSDPKTLPIENCISYNTDKTCSLCKQGYELLSNSCEPICNKDCVCFDPNTCAETNFLSNLKVKTDRNLAYCYDCDYCNTFTGYCITCSEGYYNSGGICYSCDEDCSSCYSYYSCYDCKKGYYLSSYYCYSCRLNCKSCSSYYNCDECETDYEEEDGRCVYRSKTSSIIAIIIAPIISVVVVIVIVTIVVCCVRNYRRRKLRNQPLQVANYTSTANPQYITHAPVAPLVITPQAYQNSIPPPVTMINSTRIDSTNFSQLVPLVTLDVNLRYMNEGICKICQTNFTREIDTRVLPCGHAFHGLCAYNNIAIGNNKYCLVCNRQYY